MTSNVDLGRSPPTTRVQEFEAPDAVTVPVIPPGALGGAAGVPPPIEDRLAGGVVSVPTAESRALGRTVSRQQEEAIRAFLLRQDGGPAIDQAQAQGDGLTPRGDRDVIPPLPGGGAGGPEADVGQKPVTPTGRFNEDELAVLTSHPIEAWRVRDTPELARAATAETGLPGMHNGEADAFRHAYWNALMTSRAGPEFAEALATAHETGSTNPPGEVEMDLHNNAVGRRIAVENPGATDEELRDLVLRALEAGELMTSPPSAEPAP